jgi:hypothetical protein
VLSLVTVGLLITVGTLLRFSTYFHTIETVRTSLVTDRRYLAGFLFSLVALPILLFLLPI